MQMAFLQGISKLAKIVLMKGMEEGKLKVNGLLCTVLCILCKVRRTDSALCSLLSLAVKLKLPGCRSLSLIQIYVSTLDITTSIAAHRPLASTTHPKSAFARPSLRVARS